MGGLYAYRFGETQANWINGGSFYEWSRTQRCSGNPLAREHFQGVTREYRRL
ncbi:hypothetical protein [Dokdonella sp.]|uniref:hypothetical protein n=1 Tax=Dokdonella sp. TaxID=2291710 RepID=UPI001B12031F|nr:hypothetical protein [Dokdonella sp.]MBO9661736.1 hypothetical protein [Dokdonella sp.]